MNSKDNHNPVLSQLIRAQDAYNEVTKKYEEIDTNEILLLADIAIKKAIEDGCFQNYIHCVKDLAKVEKAAIQLQEIGYSVNVIRTTDVAGPNNTIIPTYGIQISFKQMPANTRDKYTV